MLFDTDVFIWAQRGNIKAAKHIDEADERFISVQTYMEFLQGARDSKQSKLNKRFISDLGFMTLSLSENIGHRAAVYIESYSLSHGLRTGDAIIAATAMEHTLPLTTFNAKHYRFIPGLTVVSLRP